MDVQECGIFHVFFNAVLVGCGGRSAVIIAEADFHSAAAAALLLVNMSNVKPGYKNGLMFGKKWSGVISSFSRRADSAGLQLDCNGDVDEIFLEGESLDNREETEKMLGVFFGIEVVPLLLLWIILVVAAVRLGIVGIAPI